MLQPMIRLVSASMFMIAIGLALPANADEKQPEREACRDKAEGAACTFLRHVKPEEGDQLFKDKTSFDYVKGIMSELGV